MTSRSIDVTALGPGGEGFGTVDGVRVCIDGALPGERWSVVREGRGWAAGSCEIASPDRVAPGCAVFGRCGGCTWQHAGPALQREAHLDRLRRGLPASLRTTPIAYVPSELRYGYRTRARLAWSVRKDGVRLGFRARRSDDLVDIPGCPVLDAAISDALPAMRSALRALGGRGEVALALGEGGRPVASLHPVASFGSEGFTVGRELCVAGFAGVALWAPGVSAPQVDGDPRPVTLGADGAPLHAAIAGFAQAHASLNGALASHVATEAAAGERTVIELFAGAGNFTVLLAANARRVAAVEGDAAAVEALRANVALRGLGNVTVRHAAVDGSVDLRRADVVVLDPPRGGARDACEAVAKAGVRRVVYVSCDPETLGRDLGVLLGTHEVLGITAFEMFPQTPGVEAVVTLVRAGRSPKAAPRA